MHDEPEDDPSQPELCEDEKALLEEMPFLTGVGHTRRTFLGASIAGGLGFFALDLLAREEALAALQAAPDAVLAPDAVAQNVVRVAFRVNGAVKTLELDSRVVLLDALRERLALTGSKKGCDQGQCGACTVIVDGRRVLSCLTLTASVEGKEVTTVEGLAKGDQLHPMQAAFIKYDGRHGRLRWLLRHRHAVRAIDFPLEPFVKRSDERRRSRPTTVRPPAGRRGGQRWSKHARSRSGPFARQASVSG